MSETFITVEQLAKEQGCCVKTILRRVEDGIYPPLPGRNGQRGKHNKFRGWAKAYWDAWHAKQAKEIITSRDPALQSL